MNKVLSNHKNARIGMISFLALTVCFLALVTTMPTAHATAQNSWISHLPNAAKFHAGDTIIFTITVGVLQSSGGPPLSIENLTITDLLPVGVTFIAGTNTSTPSSAFTASWNGTNWILFWNFGVGPFDTDPDAIVSYNITVNSNAPAGYLFNAATYSYDETVSHAHSAPEISDFVFIGKPNISLTKTASASKVESGSSVTYTYKVNNTGDEALTVNLTDNMFGTIFTGKTMAVGESNITVISRVLVGSTTNTATATGVDQTGASVNASATVTVKVIHHGISLTKTPSASKVESGSSVTYTYAVTNTGDTSLLVSLTDDTFSSPIFTGKILAPGASNITTVSHVLTVSTTNTATATGVDQTGASVSATATATVQVIHPGAVTRYSWPMFHGDPCHTGYSQGPAPSSNLTLWSYPTGNMVVSSPAVANGKVYESSNDNRTYCLDASTGAFVWSYPTQGAWWSSPAVANGLVYVGSFDDHVYCLDALTGALVWSYLTGNYVWSSPVVVGGKVYVGSCDNRTYCLDALSGSLVWNYTTGGNVQSSPAVANGFVYVGSFDDHVYCLDALTGVLVWSYATGNVVRSSPAVADGFVYVGSFDDHVYCLDALTGALVWSCLTGNIVWSSPAVVSGKVYVGSYDNNTYCLDALTGARVWSYGTGGPVVSSPAVADGKVIVGSDDGRIYSLNASTGSLFWSYATGSLVRSSPAIADGVIYVGSEDYRIYAIGGVVRVPEDYGTIQAAINAASPGDTISVAPGVYHESIVVNKTVTIIGRVGSEPVFAGGGSGLAISIVANGVTIAGITVTNWDQGIVIAGASNCEIYDTLMSQMNSNGIAVTGATATGNQIYSNIFQNDGNAISLTGSSTGNMVYKNVVTNNVGAGITLLTNGNKIYSNTIAQNAVGINLTSSSGNTIYHNDLTGNVLQLSTPSGSNTWDNGYPSGGNYWSDYTGTDLYSGPYQNQPGSDGIYDAGYTIATNNIDRYPLTKPFNQHDIGITNLSAKSVVNRGLCIFLNVRIMNYGMSSETFPVDCWANTTLATAQAVTLAARNFTTVTVLWNTSGFALGKYIINATAGSVLGETDITDNNFTGGWVTVSILGDLTGPTPGVPDGKCDIRDIAYVAKAFGSTPGLPGWNENCDITGNIYGVPDGKVDIRDIALVAKHFGEVI